MPPNAIANATAYRLYWANSFSRSACRAGPRRSAATCPRTPRTQARCFLKFLRQKGRTVQLCQQVANHSPALVGQPHAEAFVVDGQSTVVEAELIQDRGVQVVDVNRVLDHRPADLVGLAVGDAALEAAAGQPQAVGERMM